MRDGLGGEAEMIVLRDIEQGSPEWFQARLGVVTASELTNILTPVELKRSSQAEAYRHRLLAEYLIGKPLESFESDWMKRGKEFEAEARECYAFITDKEIVPVGFIYRDENKLVGCSPDGIEESNGEITGGVEIKCLSPGKHVNLLLANRVPRDFILQVQGSMWVTGLQTWNFFGYHPDLKPLLLTVRRDERIIEALQRAVEDFLIVMLREREALAGQNGTTQALEASLRMVGVNT